MLVELAIRDFAIIDEVRIGFGPGFNALTGETGAGKSILIDALGAVLGDRIGTEVVRTGAPVAWIEATFEIGNGPVPPGLAEALDEFGVSPDEGVLILNREVQAGGRTTARINGRTATVGLLGRIGSLLVDIHGQSDHLSLLRPAAQLDLLDRYAGLIGDRQDLSSLVAELRTVRAQIDEVAGNERERARTADLLRFQVQEIESANLRVGEEEELTAERAVLANAERLAQDVSAVHALLSGDDLAETDASSALDSLRLAGASLVDVATIDAAMGPLAERLNEIVFLVEDIAAETRAYRDRVEADPARLAAVEERLDELKALKRKYGTTIEEVVQFAVQAGKELARLTGDEADLESLQRRESALLQEIGNRAEQLSLARSRVSASLARDVESAMSELNMGRAVFSVDIRHQEADDGAPARLNGTDPRPYAFDATGIDRVEFLIAPNAGEALKPLSRIASGGETARLMLALKSILSDADATPTLVFDEVDVGVGGRSGHVVGEKLWRLATSHQVLVITHLPQIAAFADRHFRISKLDREGRTVSRIDPVANDDRIEELAAMLDGLPVTPASRRSAEEMLQRVGDWTSHEASSESRPVLEHSGRQ